jgi:hypothetical protein
MQLVIIPLVAYGRMTRVLSVFMLCKMIVLEL